MVGLMSFSSHKDSPDLATDKYATLFSPATPRASPTFDDPVSSGHAIKQRHYRPPSSSHPAFVSVSTMDDPLALATSSPSVEENSTLSFFEQFGEEAKAAVSRKKHGVLDELLEHQDDPLFWVGTKDVPAPPQPPHLVDIDNDFFTHSSHIKDSVSSDSSSSNDHDTPDAADIPTPRPGRRSSNSTLSTFSSRWMSSLLSSSSNPNQLSTHPSLDALFPSDPIEDHHAVPKPPTKIKAKLKKRPSNSADPHPDPTEEVHITHGTPFGTSSTQHRSPFASHIYTPPSGAPGFIGEQYDWDKGFSAELEQERERQDERSVESGVAGERGEAVRVQQQEMASAATKIGSRKGGRGRKEVVTTVGIGGIGELIEKRSGNIELLGRQETTIGVLWTSLADLVGSLRLFPLISSLSILCYSSQHI